MRTQTKIPSALRSDVQADEVGMVDVGQGAEFPREAEQCGAACVGKVLMDSPLQSRHTRRTWAEHQDRLEPQVAALPGQLLGLLGCRVAGHDRGALAYGFQPEFT